MRVYELGLLCTFRFLWGDAVIKRGECDHLDMSVHVYYSTVFTVYVLSVFACEFVCALWLVDEIISAYSVQTPCTSQKARLDQVLWRLSKRQRREWRQKDGFLCPVPACSATSPPDPVEPWQHDRTSVAWQMCVCVCWQWTRRLLHLPVLSLSIKRWHWGN